MSAVGNPTEWTSDQLQKHCQTHGACDCSACVELASRLSRISDAASDGILPVWSLDRLQSYCKSHPTGCECDMCRQLASRIAETFSAAHHLRAETPSAVHHPRHYNKHPSGVECITIVEHFPFNIGNAIKYLWRADEKNAPIQDLEKARWYIDREIELRKSRGA